MSESSVASFIDKYEMYADEIRGILDRWEQLTQFMQGFYRDDISDLMEARSDLPSALPAEADRKFQEAAGDIEKVMGVPMPQDLRPKQQEPSDA